MSFVGSTLSDPSIPLEIRRNALARAHADPGIPDPVNSTKPFWLKDPHPKLAGIQSRELPNQADVVVIGSGISGVSIAKTLLESSSSSCSGVQVESDHKKNHPNVIILEARDICSGATGRNGGHILEAGDDYDDCVDRFGLDAARKIMRFRLAHLNEILDMVEQLGLTDETQARRVQFLNAYFDQGAWVEALARLKRFKKGMPKEAREWVAYEGEKLKELSIPTAKGIIAGQAGAIWPYKLITALLARLKRDYPDGLAIETNTPVTDININTTTTTTHGTGGTGTRKYTIQTPRGTIQTTHIIHATNAHAAHLLPGLRGRTYPVRGQMSAQSPGSKFPDYSRQYSWVFSYDRGFDYLTQLPKEQGRSDNEMMLGGGFAQGGHGGIEDLGIATDSAMSLYCDIHLSGALSAVFTRENWGAPVRGDRGGLTPVKMMWTGNMGFSADGLPWVGKVSGLGLTGRDEQIPTSSTASSTSTSTTTSTSSSGEEWISAAFSGEGMVHAWLCGKAVARMVLLHDGKLAPGDAAGDLSWFPEQMLVTEKRVKEAVLPAVDVYYEEKKKMMKTLAKM